MAMALDDLTRPRIDRRLVLLSLFSSVLGGTCLGAMVLSCPFTMPKESITGSLMLGMVMHGLIGLYAFARSRAPGACFFVLAVVACLSAAAPRVVASSACDRGSALACYGVDRSTDALELDRRSCVLAGSARACERAAFWDGSHTAAHCATWLALEDTSDAHRRCDVAMTVSLESTEARIANLRPLADGNDDVSQNSLAWLLATSPHRKVRDGELAIRYSKQSLEKRPNEAIYIDTLAAAYAEVGRYDDAIQTQRRALALLPSWQPRSDYALRLALYEAHKPARD